MNNLVVENANIGFKNFAGAAGKFNNAGNRNFCLFIDDPVLIEQLKNDGWNVKFLAARDEGDPPRAYIQIKVRFDSARPPKIVLVTSHGKTVLDEANVNILDWADIKKVDLVVNPYPWELGGRTGVTGYLKTMYVTVEEDEFENKYRDVPDAPDSARSAMDKPNDYPF